MAAAKPVYETLRRSLSGYRAHLTRVCDSNKRLVNLAATIGPVAIDGLKKGLDSLDVRIKACEDNIEWMCGERL